MLTRFDRLLGQRVDLRVVCLLRVAVGIVAVIHLEPFVSAASDGRIYRDRFYEPYVSWYPELPRSLYIGLLWLGVVTAVLMTLGVATRITTAATFGIVAYNLFLSTTHLHNNRAYLVILLGLLALAPCGRELSVDRWLRVRRGRPPLATTGPGWILWLLRFEAAAVYGASGLSKLLDADWFAGTVTWQRIVQVRDKVEASPLPGWAVDVLTNRSFHTYAAKIIVATELFIAVGLWFRRTRYAAVWVAVCFHIAIELTATVEVFSYLAIGALVIWAVPSTRDRVLVVDPTKASQRRFAAGVRAFDWLARFRVETGTPGAPLHAVDRDGAVLDGPPAAVLALSRLPVTAWFALPARLVVQPRA